MQSLSSITIKRLINDVKFLLKNPLTSENIFYKHDENNILIGYALIIGLKNTPYENGNFLFKFNFPENYPFSPPKVEFYSNDGSTRFNPNLYTNKYVCLSILNTWKGEGWTSCQSIYSILLSLQSILNENPLLNEPGIPETHKNIKIYNNFIIYKSFEFTVLKFIEYIINISITKNNDGQYKEIIKLDENKIKFLDYFECFFKDMLINFYNNIDNFYSLLENKLFDDSILVCSTFGLNCKVKNKNILKTKIDKFKNLIEKYKLIDSIEN